MFCSIALHLVPEGADHLTRLSSQKAHPTLLPPPPTAWDHRHKSFCGFLGSKLRHSPFPRQPSPFSPLPSLNSYHVNDRIPLLQGFSSFLFMFFSFFLLSLFTNSVSLNPHIFFLLLGHFRCCHSLLHLPVHSLYPILLSFGLVLFFKKHLFIN